MLNTIYCASVKSALDELIFKKIRGGIVARGETPAAIITSGLTGDVIARYLHKVRLPRNRR
jgi:hypothetical protein